MTEPFYAVVFGGQKPARMDPQEILDYSINYRAAKNPALETTDTVSAIISVIPTMSAAALGLEVLTGPKAPLIVGDMVVFWVQIKAGFQANNAWNDQGTRVGVEITVTTAEGRTFQHTGLIEVAHK